MTPKVNKRQAFTEFLPPLKIAWKVGVLSITYILATSPSARITLSSIRGEKWPMTLLTEMQVGKAIPLSRFLLFLEAKVFLTSSSIMASIVWQIVATSAPGMASSTAFARQTKYQ